MYIGNHLSASKGYAAMGRMAVKLGANTFAFFTRNPRGGAAKAIDPADVEKLLELMREQQFGKLVAHAPYTMNLCAAKEDIRKFSKEMIADDLRRMEYTPGNYYNFHPGSHVGQGADAGIEWIAEALNEVLTPEHYIDLLERCQRVLPPETVIHRLTGDGAKRDLIAPLWSADKKRVLNAIHAAFARDDLTQGSAL